MPSDRDNERMTRPVRDRGQEGEDISHAWTRSLDLDELTAVDALQLRGEREWPWQVIVPVAEFIRADPLQSELFNAITGALQKVRGVRTAVHDDREVWVISGRTRGKALVAAVGAVLDQFEPRLSEELDSLVAGPGAID